MPCNEQIIVALPHAIKLTEKFIEVFYLEMRTVNQSQESADIVLTDLTPINLDDTISRFNEEALPNSAGTTLLDGNELLQVEIPSRFERNTEHGTKPSILPSHNLIETDIIEILNSEQNDNETIVFNPALESEFAADNICNEIEIRNEESRKNIDYVTILSATEPSQGEIKNQDFRINEAQSNVKVLTVLHSGNVNSLFQLSSTESELNDSFSVDDNVNFYGEVQESTNHETNLTALDSLQNTEELLQKHAKAEKLKEFKNTNQVRGAKQRTKSNKGQAPISSPVTSNLEENWSQETVDEAEANKGLPCKLYRKLEKHEDILRNPEEIPVYDFYDEDEEKRKIEQKKEERKLKDIKERTCFHCNKTFPDAMDVLRHKRVAHPTKKIILSREKIQPYLELEDRKHCPICFAKICPKGYKSLYTKHIMVHCEDYSFSCRVCGMKFRRYDHKKNHESRHIVPPEQVE